MVAKYIIKAAVIFGLGFAVAWLVKPVTRDTQTELPASRPNSERADRAARDATRRSSAATHSEFFQLWQQTGQDARADALARLTPEEIPDMLQNLRQSAGIFEMSYADKELFEALFVTWHAKTPDTALTWLRALPQMDDRITLLGVLVNERMESDSNAALTLLRQEATNPYGRVEIPDEVMKNAAANGAEMLVAICQLGLVGKGVYLGYPLNYPEDFDFKLALDGLVAAREAKGDETDYHDLPNNLMSEWARNDPQAAWDWLQKNKSLVYNGPKEFFAAYASTTAGSIEEIATMLASNFGSEPILDSYDDAWAALGARPSAELLDGFLQSVPGDRRMHLAALFDRSWGLFGRDTDIIQVRCLLLERMSHAQRLETLRRNNPYLFGKEMGLAFGPVLRRLGHSEEDIQSVLPSLR